jgi:hypothetical protein
VFSRPSLYMSGSQVAWEEIKGGCRPLSGAGAPTEVWGGAGPAVRPRRGERLDRRGGAAIRVGASLARQEATISGPQRSVGRVVPARQVPLRCADLIIAAGCYSPQCEFPPGATAAIRTLGRRALPLTTLIPICSAKFTGMRHSDTQMQREIHRDAAQWSQTSNRGRRR